jgi:hypothetical protein
MTKITFETQYGKYIVEVNKDDMHIESIMTELIIPVLIASGFHPDTISEYINA